MSSPLVTIGVPVYNGEPYLAETLASLVSQDYADLEIILSDNGSTDSTVEIAEAVAADHPRLKVLASTENRGAAWNYNRVLELASGSLFKWAAADDICAPTFVSRCVEEIELGGPEVVIAFPRTLLIDAHGDPLRELDDRLLDLRAASARARVRQLLTHRVEWHPVFGIIRTDVLRATRGIGRFPSADIALLTELAMRGRFHQIPDRLFIRRYHDARSIIAGPSSVEQVAWYDPHRRLRVAFPEGRLTRELLAATARAPLPAPERARCAGIVLRRWSLPHWRQMGGEMRTALRTLGPSTTRGRRS